MHTKSLLHQRTKSMSDHDERQSISACTQTYICCSLFCMLDADEYMQQCTGECTTGRKGAVQRPPADTAQTETTKDKNRQYSSHLQ
eukprot:1153525-Pelagomonas_calceolata.AAC.1